jgi:hypothetical protein
MAPWQHDARAAGFDVAALGEVADLIADGVVTVDGAPIEAMPHFWVIPGFLPYEGRIIVAAVDRRRIHDGVDEAAFVGIVARAVVASRVVAA